LLADEAQEDYVVPLCGHEQSLVTAVSNDKKTNIDLNIFPDKTTTTTTI